MPCSSAGAASPIAILDLLFGIVALVLFFIVRDTNTASLVAILVVGPIWVACRVLIGRSKLREPAAEPAATAPNADKSNV